MTLTMTLPQGHAVALNTFLVISFNLLLLDMLSFFLWIECLGVNNRLECSDIVRFTVWPLEVTQVGKHVIIATKTFQVYNSSTVIRSVLLLHQNILCIERYLKRKKNDQYWRPSWIYTHPNFFTLSLITP